MNTNKNQTQEMEQMFTRPEPWEKWESKLVFGSIITAVIGLTVLGILINIFLLK
jgi:cytochrome b561